MLKSNHQSRRPISLRGLILSSVSLSALGLNMALAQTTPAAAKTPAANAGLELQTVVVTGTSSGVKKFKAPYAISTLNARQIEEKAPVNTADALKNIPGISVESTGGAAGSENIYARGLPGGSFEFFGLEEDGLPLYETNYETYLNADIFERLDLGVQRIEAVRGGTGPIFANNDPGGFANIITNNGTETEQGALKFTTGPDGLLRGDLTESGPVTKNLLMSFSGFGRIDNGLRYPGFSGGDNGGQSKIGFTYLLPSGQGKFWGNIKFLDDHGVFYSDTPIRSPINGSSLSDLINPDFGSLDSNNFDHVKLYSLVPGGGVSSVTRDLRNGINPDLVTATGGYQVSLPDGSEFTDSARVVDGRVNVDYFLNGQYVTGGADGFSAAAYAASLVKSVKGATAARYVLAGTSTVINPPDDLVLADNYVSARTTLSDEINDAKWQKSVSFYGDHAFTLGLYLSHYTFSQQRLIGTALTDGTDNAALLDVQALNASGQVLGNVTNNGFTSYGNGASGNVEGLAGALYALDNWHPTQAWEIDAGVRDEVEWEHGNDGISTTQKVTLPGDLVPVSVAGATKFVGKADILRGTAWTVGTSYQIAPPVNGFIRYTNSYSFPRFQDIYAGANFNGQPLPVFNIQQAEGGLKFYWPTLSVSAVGFYSHFNPLLTSILVQNAAGNLVTQNISAVTTDTGLEVETAWTPAPAFEVNGALTAQTSRLGQVQAPGYNTAGTDGKEEPRVPDLTASVQPNYLAHIGASTLRTFATVSFVGTRFQDYNNLSRLPAYTTVDAGATLDYGHMSYGLHVLNITNSTGLSEGNSRASAVALTPNTPVVDATVGRTLYGRTFTVDATLHW